MIRKCNAIYRMICNTDKKTQSLKSWFPDNCPPVRVRVWFRVSVELRVAGQFSSGAIVLEPYYICCNLSYFDFFFGFSFLSFFDFYFF